MDTCDGNTTRQTSMNASQKLAQAKWLASQNYAAPSVLEELLNASSDQDLFTDIGSRNGWSDQQIEECRWAFLLATPIMTAKDLQRILHSTKPGAHYQFQDYVILEEISRGGMGIVFRAIHKESRASVALKLLLDDNPTELSEQFFEREALALAHLSHPNIVQIKTYGRHIGIPYIVMELVEGCSLEDFVKNEIRAKGRIAISLICEIFQKLAEALDYTHEKGLIHRDLKPQNILLVESAEGLRPIIIDFGLVKRAPENLNQTAEQLFKNLSLSHEVKGTPAYMAPEQLDPKSEFGDISPATDVWGLAGTLFFALTGESPVDAVGGNPMTAILMTPFPSPRSHRSDCPKSLDILLQKSFQKRADTRPTLTDFAAVLSGKKSMGMGWKSLTLIGMAVLIVGVVAFFGLKQNWENQQRSELVEITEYGAEVLKTANKRLETFQDLYVQGEKLDTWRSEAAKELLILKEAVKKQKQRGKLYQEMGEDPTELIRSLRDSQRSFECLRFVAMLDDPFMQDQALASERCEELALASPKGWISHLLLLQYSRALKNSEACFRSYSYFIENEPKLCRLFPKWLEWHRDRSDWKGYQKLLNLLNGAALNDEDRTQLLGIRLNFELRSESQNAKKTFQTMLLEPKLWPERLVSGAIRLSRTRELPNKVLASLKKSPYQKLAFAGLKVEFERYHDALKILSGMTILTQELEANALHKHLMAICYDRLFEGRKAIDGYQKLFDSKIPGELSDLRWNAARRLVLLVCASERLEEVMKVILSLQRTEQEPGGRNALISCLLSLRKAYRISEFREMQVTSRLKRLKKTLKAYSDDPRVQLLLRIEENPSDPLDDFPDSYSKRGFLLFREYRIEQDKPGFAQRRGEFVRRYAKLRAEKKNEDLRSLLRVFQFGRGFWNDSRRTKSMSAKTEHIVRRILFSHPFHPDGYIHIQRAFISRGLKATAIPFAVAAGQLDPCNPVQCELNASLSSDAEISIAHLKAAIEFDKNSQRDMTDRARVHCILGRLYLKEGKTKEGKLQLEIAEKLGVNDVAILNSLYQSVEDPEWRERIGRRKKAALNAYECLDVTWRAIVSAKTPAVESLRGLSKDLSPNDRALATALLDFVDSAKNGSLSPSLSAALIEHPPIMEAYCLTIVPTGQAPDRVALSRALQSWRQNGSENPDEVLLQLAINWLKALISGFADSELSKNYQAVFQHLEKKHPSSYSLYFLSSLVMALEGSILDADSRLEFAGALIPNPYKQGVKPTLERASIPSSLGKRWFFPLCWGGLSLELRRLCLLKLGRRAEATKLEDELKLHPDFQKRAFVKLLRQRLR